jgi:hypothetical protein
VADNGEEDQSLPNDPSTGHGGQGGQGGDIGNLKLPRGARDNRGGLDRTVNPGVRLVGTKTGAGDEEEANVGTPSQTATGRDADPGSPGNVDDVGGHRGLRSGAGGAQVTGFAARIWWLLWGERGQPREME